MRDLRSQHGIEIDVFLLLLCCHPKQSIENKYLAALMKSMSDVDRLIYRNEELSMRIVELETQLKEVGAFDIERLLDEWHQMKNDLEASNTRLGEALSERDAARSQLASIGGSISELTAALQLQRANESSGSGVKNQSTQRTRLPGESGDAVEAELSECKSKLEVLEARYQQLQADHDSLFLENETLRRNKPNSAEGQTAMVMQQHEQKIASLQERNDALTALVSSFQATDENREPATSRVEPDTRSLGDHITDHKATLCDLNQKMAALMENGCKPDEMKLLVELVLDGQELAFNDMKDRVMIQELSYKDKVKALMKRVQRLEVENTSLQSILAAATTPKTKDHDISCPNCTFSQSASRDNCMMCSYSFR